MYAKYIETLRLMTEVVGVGNNDELINPAWDQLYTFIHANFPVPKSSVKNFDDATTHQTIKFCYETSTGMEEINECFDMLVGNHSQEEILQRLGSMPPGYSDEIFPVAIARFLLRYQNVRVDHRKLTTFDEFHVRYGAMIFGSCDRKYKKKAA